MGLPGKVASPMLLAAVCLFVFGVGRVRAAETIASLDFPSADAVFDVERGVVSTGNPNFAAFQREVIAIACIRP